MIQIPINVMIMNSLIVMIMIRLIVSHTIDHTSLPYILPQSYPNVFFFYSYFCPATVDYFVSISWRHLIIT